MGWLVLFAPFGGLVGHSTSARRNYRQDLQSLCYSRGFHASKSMTNQQHKHIACVLHDQDQI
jgi:hypothetical protein